MALGLLVLALWIRFPDSTVFLAQLRQMFGWIFPNEVTLEGFWALPANDAVFRLPAELYQRGVKIAFASYDAHNARNLPYAAADRLAHEGIDVEVIDPRTIAPLDTGTIIESVRRTGHLLIVDEAGQVALADALGVLPSAPRAIALGDTGADTQAALVKQLEAGERHEKSKLNEVLRDHGAAL